MDQAAHSKIISFIWGILGEKGIHVAEYLTALPPRELLEQRLHTAVVRARQQLDGLESTRQPRQGSAK